MTSEPEVIADFACTTAEGPLWNVSEQRLYWTDIPRGRLYRYDPVSGTSEQIYQGRPIGGFTFQRDGALLLFLDSCSVALWRDGAIERFVLDELPGETETRFNDCIACPNGDVFCGTLAIKDKQGRVTHPGSLYHLHRDGRIEHVRTGVGHSNGMAFSPDRRHLYWTDTGAKIVWQFDYDETHGSLGGDTRLIELGPNAGPARPDGLTVDAEGCLWSAHYGGAAVVRYAPSGELLSRIELPVGPVTCPAFGGADLKDLYITTAGGDDRGANGSLAGAVFRVRPGVQGVVEFASAVGL